MQLQAAESEFENRPLELRRCSVAVARIDRRKPHEPVAEALL